MPTTVSDLIHSAFRLIGAIAAGELLETDELDDAFISLNQMVSSWNTEGASLVGRTRIIVPTGSTNYYPLNTRPVKIESASVATAGIDCPLELVDAIGWSTIPEQGMLSVFVKKLFCDYAFPASAVWIWPTPRSTGALTMWIYQAIAEFGALDEPLNLPPGYEAGLRFTFACNIAPEYGRPLDPSVVAQAQQFKASLVQLNQANQMITQPPAAATVVPAQKGGA